MYTIRIFPDQFSICQRCKAILLQAVAGFFKSWHWEECSRVHYELSKSNHCLYEPHIVLYCLTIVNVTQRIASPSCFTFVMILTPMGLLTTIIQTERWNSTPVPQARKHQATARNKSGLNLFYFHRIFKCSFKPINSITNSLYGGR